MSVLLRTAVRALIVLALLATAACSGQTTLDLAGGDSVAKESAHARNRGKHKGHHKQHKRHWKPKCRCKCTPTTPKNKPPVAAVALATVNGTTFDFRPEGSYDPDGTLVKYEWDWESDGVYDFSSADGLTSHSFAGGDHTITLRVTDNKGATATATFDLTANFPPTAKIGIATANGTTYSFSADESSDPEGPLHRWEWDFDGDGIFEETYFSDPGPLSRSFPGGDYEVSLRVTDGLDATDTETITVHGNFKPDARISVEFEEIIPSVLARYTLHFNESSDFEGPLDSGFYTINGGPPVAITDWDAPVVLDVNEFSDQTVILTVLDGLWLTDTHMVALTVTGPIFAEE